MEEKRTCPHCGSDTYEYIMLYKVNPDEVAYDKARRTAQYCGNTGDAADITGALDGIHIECKRVEKLNIYDAVNQAKRDAKGGLLPTVFHRKNHCEWLVTMPLDAWMRLYGDFEPDVPFTDLEGE